MTAISHAFAAVAATGALTGIMVLPGFGILALVRRHRPETNGYGLGFELARAVGVSVLVVAVVAYPLVAFGWFAPWRVLLVVVPIGLAGLPRAIRFVAEALRGWRRVGLLAALLLPFAPPLVQDGHTPALGFNWFYWDLGRSMSSAGGVPRWVTEFGETVRWQPDYLTFGILTESYRGLLVGIDDAVALDSWKLPVAALTVAMLYATLRLWFRPWTATVGVALCASTTLFTDKVGNGRPEIVGFTIGLTAAVIAVHAMRRRDLTDGLLAVAVLAVTTSIHGIGVVVPGLIIASAALVELVDARDRDRRLLFVQLAVAGIVGVVIVLATGWSLQGRTSVIGDAAKPERTEQYGDPTYTFIRWSYGQYEVDEPPEALEALGLQVRRPWKDFSLSSGLGPLAAVGIVTAGALGYARGDRRTRQALTIVLSTGAVLCLGATYFQVAFDTFVPQHTGRSRFLQWSPIIYVLLLTGGVAAFERYTTRTEPRAPHRLRVVVPTAGAIITLFAMSAMQQRFDDSLRVDAEHDDALAALTALAEPTDVVLSNATTSGIVEFISETEVLLEGRQPFIEEPDVLVNALDTIDRARRFLEDPTNERAGADTGATLVMITDRPARLAAADSFGGSVDSFENIGETLHRSEHVLITRIAPPTDDPTPRIGPVVRTPARFLVGVAGVAATIVLGMACVRRFGGRQPQQSAEGATITTPSRTAG